MKRLFTLIVTALTALCIYASDTEPINLVFIGNSITYGANLSDPATQAPPVKTARMVREQTGRDVYFRNCGLSGSATPGWMPGQTLFTNADNAANDLQKAHPGTLFFSMMLGTNDTHQGYKTSPETYYENMKTIIEELITRHPEAHIIVNYPTWYSPNTHNGAVYLQEGLDRLKTYMPMITKLCELFQKSERPQVWPGDPTVFSFFEDQKQYFVAENGNSGVFYLHPNTTGGTKLAEFWTKSIIEHLGDLKPLHTQDELLLDKARTAQASCISVDKAKLTQESQLVTATNLSTDAVALEGCRLQNLTDLTPTTFFEVDEKSTSPATTPYLQVDLNGKPTEQLVLSLQKRSDSGVSAKRDWTPTDITILASTDGEQWQRLTGLHNITTTNGYYVSPIVSLGEQYSHLRICINDMASLNISEGGALTWSLSELQLHSVTPDLPNSPYSTVEGLKEACDELTALISECSAATELTDGQRTALTEAIARVEALYTASDPGSDVDPNIVYINDLNSDDTYYYDKKKGLITLRTNLKANSEEKNAGTYFGTGNLISNSTDYNTIIWHTDWTTNPLPLGVDNYLQAKLKTKQRSICFSMIGSNWNSTYDTPDRMVILATNTPSDESSWKEIVELPDLIPAELHNVHPAFYDSPRIDLGDEYSSIRFVIKETVNHRTNSKGNIYVSLARFQVYAPTLVEDKVKQLGTFIKQVSEKTSGIEAGIMPGFYPQEKVDAFRGVLSKAVLLVNMNPTQEEAADMQAELSAAYKALEESIIRLEAGYYWIQSAYPGFEKAQGTAKAMKAVADEDLQWATFDAGDPSQLFRLQPDGADWKIQSVATGTYIGQPEEKGKRISLGNEGATLTLSTDGGSSFTIKNQGSPIAVETTRSDAMPQGFVAAGTPNPKELSLFYLIPEGNEAKLQELSTKAEALQAMHEASQLLTEAKGSGSREMLTQGSQLYANSQMSGFPVSNLLDKGTAYDKIIFHTIWGNGALPASEKNYIQVDLREPQQHISFSMVGSSWSSTYDTPDDYVILATDTPSDEASWQTVTELHDMIPQALHTTYPAFYTSPIIDLGAPYTNLRFVVMSTVNNRGNGQGNIYVSLARFQVYGDATSSKYLSSETLASAVDTMLALVSELKATASPTPDQVAQLRAQNALVRSLLDGGTSIRDINSTPATSHLIYNIAGQRLTTPQRGLNIVDGKKVVK